MKARLLALASSRRALVAAWLVGAVFLSSHALRHLRDPITEVDEAAVVYSTGYLGLVMRGELSHERWRAIDAIDHPPAWKYVHGLALLAAGRPLGSLEEKDVWLDWAWDDGDDPGFKAHLAETVTAADLAPGRLLSLVALIGALGLFARLLSRASSVPVAVLATLVLGTSVPMKWVAARALIDGLLLFAILGCASLTARWLERGPLVGKSAPASAALLGVLLGLTTQTKITGVVGVLGVLVLGLAVARRAPARRGLALMLGVTALSAFAINPALWRDPIGVALSMLDHRAHQLELQMLFSKAQGYIPLSEGLRRFTQRIVAWPDPLWRAAYIPFVATATVLGVLCVARSPRPVGAARLALLALLVPWGVITALTFRLDWIRYLLPALPLSVWLFAEGLVAAFTAPRARALALSAVSGLALALATSRAPAESLAERAAKLTRSRALLERELAEGVNGPHKTAALLRRRAQLEAEGGG